MSHQAGVRWTMWHTQVDPTPSWQELWTIHSSTGPPLTTTPPCRTIGEPDPTNLGSPHASLVTHEHYIVSMKDQLGILIKHSIPSPGWAGHS